METIDNQTKPTAKKLGRPREIGARRLVMRVSEREKRLVLASRREK